LSNNSISSIRKLTKDGDLILRENTLTYTLDKFSGNIDSYLNNSTNFYPSTVYKDLVDILMKRIEGESINSIHVIYGGFGSGKTQLLSKLVEVISKNNSDMILHMDGLNQDEVDLQTIIIDKLKLQSTSNNFFTEFKNYLQNKPLIIIIDEIVVYLKKLHAIKEGDTNKKELALVFLQQLSVEVAKSKNAALLISIPSDQQLYQNESMDVIDIIDNLDAIFNRISSRHSPIIKQDFNKLLTSYFFKDINPKIKNTYIQSLYTEIQELDSFFPFNYYFIESLWDRLYQKPGFQYLRGILRLLSIVVQNLPDDISIAYIDLTNLSVREEFYRFLSNHELYDVIVKDIHRIHGLGNLAIKITNIIGLNSLLGYSTTESEIIHICQNRFVSKGIIIDIMDKIEENQWYLTRDNNNFVYKVEPNIIKQVSDNSIKINNSDITQFIEEILRDRHNSNLYKLLFSSENKSFSMDKINLLIKDIDNKTNYDLLYFTNKGNINPQINSIILLYSSTYDWIDKLKQFLALKYIDKKLKLKYDHLIQRLSSRSTEYIITSFNQIDYIKNGVIHTENKYLPSSENIIDFLINDGIVFTTISSEYLLHILNSKTNLRTIKNVVEAFHTDTQLPKITSTDVLLSPIKQLVEQNLLTIQKLQSTQINSISEIENLQLILNTEISDEKVVGEIEIILPYTGKFPFNESFQIQINSNELKINDFASLINQLIPLKLLLGLTVVDVDLTLVNIESDQSKNSLTNLPLEVILTLLNSIKNMLKEDRIYISSLSLVISSSGFIDASTIISRLNNLTNIKSLNIIVKK